MRMVFGAEHHVACSRLFGQVVPFVAHIHAAPTEDATAKRKKPILATVDVPGKPRKCVLKSRLGTSEMMKQDHPAIAQNVSSNLILHFKPDRLMSCSSRRANIAMLMRVCPGA